MSSKKSSVSGKKTSNSVKKTKKTESKSQKTSKVSQKNSQKNKIIEEIKKELNPLFRKDISFVYIYGSFKEGHYNDIDILVVADDFVVSEKDIKSIQLQIAMLQKKNQNKFNLHFQPLKFLSAWWKAIIQGEPWILTSLKNNIILYDKDNILSSVKNLIKTEKTYNSIIKYGDLSESSREFDLENREILLESLESLSAILKEAVQVYLLSQGKIMVDKDKIYKELANSELKKYAEDYKEILDLESKYQRGFLNEFTAENLDYYLNKIKNLLNLLEEKL